MKAHLLVILVVLCFLQMSFSQEDDGVVSLDLPIRNSLVFNRYAINPTFSFVREQHKYASISNKREWVQFDNAPETYLASYSGRFSENIGAGLALFQQNYGVLTTFGGLLNFAYNAQLSTDNNLTFGLNIGAYKSGVNTANVVTNFDDPSLQNVPSNFLLTVNPGINFGTEFLDFGISVNNVVLYNFESSTLIEDDPKQGIQAHVMHTGYFNGRGFFTDTKVSALLKSEFRKDETIISGLAMINVPKGLWFQIGYNNVYGVSGGIGLNITSQIALEYNVERAIGDMVDFGPSHDFTLAYRFKSEKKYKYSGDDEVSGLFSKKQKVIVKASESELAGIRSRAAERKAQEKLDLEAKKITEAEAKAKLVAEAKAKKEAEAKAKEDSKVQAKLLKEQREKEEAEAKAKLDEEEKARQREVLRAKIAANQKAKREAEAKLKAEQEAKLAVEQKAAADAQAKLLAEQEAKLEAEKQVRLLAEQKIKEEAEAQAKLKAEQEAKAEAEKQSRLLAEQKAKEEAELQAKLQAEQEAKLEAEKQARLLADQKAKEEAEAQAKLLAEQKVAEDLIANPKDELGKSMKTLEDQTDDAKTTQVKLLKQFDEIVATKDQDLKDLKEENDLSDQGIVVQPKPFKSVTAENNALRAIKSNLDDVIKTRSDKIEELQTLYEQRTRIRNTELDEVNIYYKKKIKRLTEEQAKAVQTRAQLDSRLETIRVATEFEKRRRIKRAAFDNEEDRYSQDRTALTNIKNTTTISKVPLKTEDFDFGEEQGNNINILKNIKNVESGYYVVIAVHSNVEKRNDFVTKVVASGRTNVDFFYDVNTSKYYIYYDKFDSIQNANKALESKGDRPYNQKMSIVKIEN
ncbi:PorP/SprF family type IX secretion system membrane protein [uncultured Winogradskyella sp.]|uniref:PorP/SprF family type IX secretion system membrane protein n=1 Tax=uncultured Winogradskyella sp. TaxID=395353 RepID=UPI002627DCDD|nr:PorP/SprF family type IX secretion system membrane protein [uncultured Winogradskyella sp.]